MKTSSLPVPIFALTFFLVVTGTAQAQTNPAPSTPAAPATKSATPAPAPTDYVPPRMPVFHPPGVTGGVLPIQVGGGSRGSSSNGVTVAVLTPNAIALTTQAQPSLYWYQSKDASTECEITVTQPKVAKPLLVLTSTTPTKAGLHVIKLSDHTAKLDVNVLYKWSVAVVVDPSNRSEDITAYGVIKRVEPTPDLTQKLSSAPDSERAALYADAGIWYDALDSVSTLIASKPDDQPLLDQRTTLLKQVGLDDIAKSMSVPSLAK